MQNQTLCHIFYAFLFATDEVNSSFFYSKEVTFWWQFFLVQGQLLLGLQWFWFFPMLNGMRPQLFLQHRKERKLYKLSKATLDFVDDLFYVVSSLPVFCSLVSSWVHRSIEKYLLRCRLREGCGRLFFPYRSLWKLWISMPTAGIPSRQRVIMLWFWLPVSCLFRAILWIRKLSCCQPSVCFYSW